MLSVDHLSRTPRARWDTTSAGQRADRDPALLVGAQEDVGQLLEQPTFARVGRAAVIDNEGRPAGVLSLTDIERAIRASGLGGPSSDKTSLAAR
jgi:CBS domain-containing protein